MTTAHFEKFADLVGKDPALLAKLGSDKVYADAAAAAASAQVFITNAVKEAKALGQECDAEEVRKLEKLAAAADAWEFEKFAELVGKDPALLAKLGLDKVNADAAAAAASAAAFITNAVKEAKALGLEFTAEEVRAYMAAELKAEASGELSDTQLDAVAGGATINTSRSNKRPTGNLFNNIGSCLGLTCPIIRTLNDG